MPTITIIIKGIAICYKRGVHPNHIWRVLFPFDECHNVLFSWITSDGEELPDPKISFARAGGQIDFNITTGTAAPPDASETALFRDRVLNLTNINAGKPLTHARVKTLLNWRDGTVLMEINHAKFSIDRHVQDLTNERPVKLIEENESNLGTGSPVSVQNLGQLAHSVKATIELNAGAVLRVSGVNQDFTGGETLIFDNDCKDKREGNDMDMFYKKIIFEPDTDPTKNKRRFIVGERKKGNGAMPSILGTFLDIGILSIPLSLAEGKPCLVAQVTESDDLP